VGGRYNQGCIYRAEYFTKDRCDGSSSADVQGYSGLMGEDEVATIRTLIA
jgi:hypothetical protein